MCKLQGAELRAIPIDKNGDLILSELEQLITPRTKFISVGHVNNTFGTINDVESIIRTAHSHNIPVLIDGAQSIAHTKVDVQQLDCDFFVFSGHKIYGPSGIGVVYGKKEWLEQLPPWQGGGNMIKDVTIEHTEFNAPPARFEAGTPNIADAIGVVNYVLKNEMTTFVAEAADMNGDGKTDRGSVKENVHSYIFYEMDLDFGSKCILYKNKYKTDDTYNMDIINYINERGDLTYEERIAIFTELGFTVENGTVSW